MSPTLSSLPARSWADSIGGKGSVPQFLGLAGYLGLALTPKASGLGPGKAPLCASKRRYSLRATGALKRAQERAPLLCPQSGPRTPGWVKSGWKTTVKGGAVRWVWVWGLVSPEFMFEVRMALRRLHVPFP